MQTVELPDHKIFGTVAEAAAELNVETYVIGGFVRDLILKRPSKDIDVVCVGNGIELAEKTAEKSHTGRSRRMSRGR